MSSSLSALDLDQDNRLLQLARELAMDIYELDVILKLNGITPRQFEEDIKPSERFQNYLTSAKLEWNSALNTQERVAIKSATSVELALPEIHRSMVDQTIPLAQRVEALKIMAKLGRVADQAQGMVTGSGFSVSITIGTTEMRFDTKQVEPATIEGKIAA